MWKFHPSYDPTLSQGITILTIFESSLLIRILRESYSYFSKMVLGESPIYSTM